MTSKPPQGHPWRKASVTPKAAKDIKAMDAAAKPTPPHSPKDACREAFDRGYHLGQVQGMRTAITWMQAEWDACLAGAKAKLDELEADEGPKEKQP